MFLPHYLCSREVRPSSSSSDSESFSTRIFSGVLCLWPAQQRLQSRRRQARRAGEDEREKRESEAADRLAQPARPRSLGLRRGQQQSLALSLPGRSRPPFPQVQLSAPLCLGVCFTNPTYRAGREVGGGGGTKVRFTKRRRRRRRTQQSNSAQALFSHLSIRICLSSPDFLGAKLGEEGASLARSLLPRSQEG